MTYYGTVGSNRAKITSQHAIDLLLSISGVPHEVQYTAQDRVRPYGTRVLVVPLWVSGLLVVDFGDQARELLRYAIDADLGDALAAFGDDPGAVIAYVQSHRAARGIDNG